ncbi:hypothetical protein ABRY23_09705 [Melioribacteraceae bacterium 4301-Me]|uniref:hypothetical protein n=1 Tax=Pyranulibacter aquaticus TaxID=3163344 RepID=UPI003594A7E6
MKTEEIKKMVNEFFDKELDKAKEPLLFNLLASDEESREYFKQLNNIKNIIEDTAEEFSPHLEERIFHSLENYTLKEINTSTKRNILSLLAYSFAVILLFLCLIFYNQTQNYRDLYQSTLQQVNAQNKTIQLLINSLPAVEVDYKIQNPVIVKAKM